MQTVVKVLLSEELDDENGFDFESRMSGFLYTVTERRTGYQLFCSRTIIVIVGGSNADTVIVEQSKLLMRQESRPEQPRSARKKEQS